MGDWQAQGLGNISYRRESTDPRTLVRDIMGYGGPIKCLPPQIQWGWGNEEEAWRCYIRNREAVGVIKESGLHLIPDKAYLGASSNGLVTCTSVDLCCHGCLEIKCPYSIDKVTTVEMSPMEIAKRSNFSWRRERMWIAFAKAAQILRTSRGRIGYENGVTL